MNKFNNNKLEITLCLSEEDFLHVREIERRTGLDIKTVSRELKALTEMNVLDYKKIGKNKHFFLKDTLESFNMEVMSELHKTNKLIQRNELLSVQLQELHDEADFLIFGSYANNTQTKNSDIDLAIFSRETKKTRNILSLINKKVHIQRSTYKEFVKLVKKKQPLYYYLVN